ncbi:MFS transporter [Noviherbaspirillum suwonense]|uniref:Predicted arabinose efflux permease, MFS family n=1 Tax=Noviherbaspirillum suwonense TaxID=1224511 RepID=A0ABY1QA36_9BURK|nr:MFS transporter [Noviherbaspirillum suwonense]SMP65163.1 Predicted arabinose efflux permease, MFS family [Noviherbaspirillum suwonense]
MSATDTNAASAHSSRAAWALMLAAAAIMMLTMGARQTMGLFLSPLNTATGLGIASISLALAVGQLMWGVAQPIFGAVADRYGSMRVIILGALMLAAGTALTPFMHSQAGLLLSMGVLSAAGAGAGSFSILIGAASQRLPAERRAFASGFINAGGSFGQFVFAPAVQAVISSAGWVAAMLSIAASALLTIPLAWPLRTPPRPHAAAAPAGPGLGAQLRLALRDRSYLCLHAGFFTCGFHIAFLVTHLPGEVGLCGLPASVSAAALALIGLFNIAGSLSAGMLASRYRMKSLLALMYASRAVIILVYLAAPKTAMTFYVFAAALGFTWLATVPPTAGLVAKLFGVRYLATLFGLTLLSHQVGGFFGAWLGGLAFVKFGNYNWMWYVDIALALAAALVNLPIREAPVLRPAAAVQ